MTTPNTFRPVTARLPAAVFDELARLADQEQRSLSNMVRLIVTQHVEQSQGHPKPSPK